MKKKMEYHFKCKHNQNIFLKTQFIDTCIYIYSFLMTINKSTILYICIEIHVHKHVHIPTHI